MSVMEQDLKDVDPIIKNKLKKGIAKLVTKSLVIYDSYLCSHAELKLPAAATNKIFMYRPHVKNTPLPHKIKSDYKIFIENSSEHVHENYTKTLESLLSNEINEDDKTRLRNLLTRAPLNIFSWSNTGILLNKMMQDSKSSFINANIITFGSPVLVKKYACNKCINVYHQDDWILGLLKHTYKGFDFSNVKKNVIHKTTTNEEFIILSRACFVKSRHSPHQSFNLFL